MSDTLLTAYKAAKQVNEVLTTNNLKNIPPQMMYNYVSKGLITTEDVNGQKLIRQSVLNEWAEKYVAKKIEALTK